MTILDFASEVGDVSDPCCDGDDHPDNAGWEPDSLLAKAKVAAEEYWDGESANYFYDSIKKREEGIADSSEHATDYIYQAKRDVEQAGDFKTHSAKGDDLFIFHKETGDGAAKELHDKH